MKLDDTFRLTRASTYNNPLNGADLLPDVYGNCFDGSNGVWKLPCIDTVSFVYAFSGIDVLSVANGNTIEIFSDGILVSSGNYTFDELNDYESNGNIATITFTSDQGNAVISAKGKGRATGTTLIQNVIDIINDVLTVQSDFASGDFEATSKATASAIFDAEGYVAAGIIDKDIVFWDLVTKMMSSFLGSAYLTGTGKLYLNVDDGNINQYNFSALIPESDIEFKKSTQAIDNMVNRAEANFSYNYLNSKFASTTDDNTYGNVKSQNLHGTLRLRTPYQFYWCRNIANIQAIQRIIVEKFGNPIRIIEFTDETPKRLNVEVGDLIATSFENLFDTEANILRNGFFRVLAVTPDYQKSSIDFRVLETEKFKTESNFLANGNYLADGSIKAGGSRDLTVY